MSCDHREFEVSLKASAKMFNRTLADCEIEMWYNAIGSFDMQVIRTAFSNYMCNDEKKFGWPLPGAILKIINGSSEGKADEAWSDVDLAVRCVSPKRSVVFSDPVIHTVIDTMGGWPSLCRADYKQHSFNRREFIRIYLRVCSENILEHPKILLGTPGNHNSVSEPALIGDKDKCREVYKAGIEHKSRLHSSPGKPKKASDLVNGLLNK